MLAGLVKSPSRLAPNRNPEGAEQRAQVVLAAMADAKFITDAPAKASIGQPSIAVKPAGAGTVNYVADWIGEVLDDLVGQIDQDIVVQTTIDPKLQAVAEAAVIGVHHPKWDERPLLIVQLKQGESATREDILKFMDGKIAKWWMPDDVAFVDGIPHTATGKILKTALRDQFKDYTFPTAAA